MMLCSFVTEGRSVIRRIASASTSSAPMVVIGPDSDLEPVVEHVECRALWMPVLATTTGAGPPRPLQRSMLRGRTGRAIGRRWQRPRPRTRCLVAEPRSTSTNNIAQTQLPSWRARSADPAGSKAAGAFEPGQRRCRAEQAAARPTGKAQDGGCIRRLLFVIVQRHDQRFDEIEATLRIAGGDGQICRLQRPSQRLPAVLRIGQRKGALGVQQRVRQQATAAAWSLLPHRAPWLPPHRFPRSTGRDGTHEPRSGHRGLRSVGAAAGEPSAGVARRGRSEREGAGRRRRRRHGRRHGGVRAAPRCSTPSRRHRRRRVRTADPAEAWA